MNRMARYYFMFLSLLLVISFQNCSKVSFGGSADSAPQQDAHVQSGGGNNGGGQTPGSGGGSGLDPSCLVSKGCDPIAKVVQQNCKDDSTYIDWSMTKTDAYPKLADYSYSKGGSDLGTFESIDNVRSISSDGGILQARTIQTITSISASTDINATSIGSISVSAHVCLHNLASVGNMSLSGQTFILGAGKLTITSLSKISDELLVSDASIGQLNQVSAPVYLRGVTLSSLTNCTASIFTENTTINSMDASCAAKLVQLP